MWVKGVFRGGLCCGSVYGKVGEGIGPVNKQLLTDLQIALGNIRGRPWVLMGDWNITPDELAKSGWLEKVGGRIVHPGKATSHAGKGERIIDYFVVSASLESVGAILSCDTLGTGIVATHSVGR